MKLIIKNGMNENNFSLEKNKIKISSAMGIVLRESRDDRKIIDIPIGIFRKIGGKEEIRKKIFPKIFKGSYYDWAEEFEDCFSVELPHDVSQEQAQQLVDEIEKL